MYLSSVDVGVFLLRALYFLRPWETAYVAPQSRDQELLIPVHKKLDVSFHM